MILALGFLTLSCSHMGSGQYVQIRKGDTYKKLAKEFKTEEWTLKEANKSKPLRIGEWFFVPLNRGIMGAKSYRIPANTAQYMASGRFLWPVPSSSRISSGFGRRWGRHHDGIDIPARTGAHIVSVDDGVVVYSGRKLGAYGNITVIAHNNGLFSVYAHADKNYTRKGQKVHRGQVIATIGSTGRSTGPHLHFEIRKDSKALNPKKFVSFRKK
jgi:murein DD-endopeptidase MepM/ murein hydrolase activator NlpD